MAQASRMILEIGCGRHPWFLQRVCCLDHQDEYAPVLTPILEEYGNCFASDRFVCVDSEQRALDEATEELAAVKELLWVKEKFPSFDGGNISFIRADGKRLPFASGLADVVVMSNVLSSPPPGVDNPEFWLRDSHKWRIVKDALRVLKDGGMLIISANMTPRYASPILDRMSKELVETGRIYLRTQCGELARHSDDWHLYQVVFQKGGLPSRPIVVPWTQEQIEYSKRKEWSWFCSC